MKPVPHTISIPSHSRCWAEVDLSALVHNARLARKHAGCDVMAIVKANAYGHGAASVAAALQTVAAMFGVANLEEARELRAAGVRLPVLLLGTCLPEEREEALKMGVHLSISSLQEAVEVNAAAQKLDVTATAHFILDTGMGRMGLPCPQWDAGKIHTLLQLPNISWEGLASHFPSADGDAEGRAFTVKQIHLFRDCVHAARELGMKPRFVHLSNSAGVLGFDETHDLCNLARPGLMLYGVSPLEKAPTALRPALRWMTRVLLVRELPAGHGVSYGRSFVTTRSTRVATLAAGYADGYPRQASGHGAEVLLQGIRCPILGRITMDQLMVDVTALPEPVLPGNEAVLLGAQGADRITAEELAAKAGTIPWHIFTGIGERVQRFYIESELS